MTAYSLLDDTTEEDLRQRSSALGFELLIALRVLIGHASDHGVPDKHLNAADAVVGEVMRGSTARIEN